MADTSDRWTIRGVELAARNAAIGAAKRDRMPIGEWLARAIRAQVQSDRQTDRAPTIVGPLPLPPVGQAADLADVERTVALVREMSDSGLVVPPGVARAAFGLIRVRLVALRSLTIPAKSLTNGAAGPTSEGRDGPPAPPR